MERNYKSIQIGDKWFVEVEYYRNYHIDWSKKIFTDWNGDKLQFFSKGDADEWIVARRGIMNVWL
jgi:hypothetical protein